MTGYDPNLNWDFQKDLIIELKKDQEIEVEEKKCKKS